MIGEVKKRTDKNKSICLPQISLCSTLYYKQPKNSKAKKPRKVYWYTDYIIEMSTEKAADIVALMGERERFKGLREFTEKLLRTQNNDYRTRFIIDAQTQQDCYLAVIYINYHLGSVRYHANPWFCYTQTCMYHTNWRDHNTYQSNYINENPDGLCIKTEDKKYDNEEETKHSDPETEPMWLNGRYPMYIDAGSANYTQVTNDTELTERYDLIYALSSREPTSMPGLGFTFGGLGGFDDFDTSVPVRKPDDALTLLGFKRIYIPDAEIDELRDLFEQIAFNIGLKLDKTLKFDTLKKEYERFLATESDVLSIAETIKEYKIFEGKLNTPVTYKDFCTILDTASARKEHAADKKSDKKAKSPWDELNSLIGNEGIKRDVRRMVDALLLNKRRRELGLPGTALTMHSLFFGSPGTSKTTVSRLIAKILKHEGIIKGDSFRECVKSDILGQFVGWTAANVDKIFSELAESGGGVLFLDEAYTYSQDPTCFDREAINCIVQGMENHKKIMCIFAGYKEPMQQFVEANPGLRSRIGFIFGFNDYDSDAMLEIAKYQAQIFGFMLPSGCEQMLSDYFTELKHLQGDGWGNGREARKILEQASLQLAERLAKQKRKASKTECTHLTLEDVTAAIKNNLEKERAFGQEQRRRIGFYN